MYIYNAQISKQFSAKPIHFYMFEKY